MKRAEAMAAQAAQAQGGMDISFTQAPPSSSSSSSLRRADSNERHIQQLESSYMSKKRKRKHDDARGAHSDSALGGHVSGGGGASSAVDSASDMSSSEEEEAIGVEFEVVPDKNLVNSSMRNLYNKTTPTKPALTPSSSAAATAAATAAIVNDINTSKPPRHSSSKPSKRDEHEERKASGRMTKKREKKLRHRGSSEKEGKGQDGDSATIDALSSSSSWRPEPFDSPYRYSDLGGIEGILQDVRELIEYPLTHPEIYAHLGVEPPRGVLLHGPPGCGKTLLAHAIAGELQVPFLKISAPEVVSGMSGESEQKIRQLFADALAMAPCLLFIDEVDSIAPKRATAQREMERRIVAQLLTCMDSLSTAKTGDPTRTVIVIGATNRPDSLDDALRRAGRFDREIAMGIPDDAARQRILSVMCRSMRMDGEFDFASVAKKAVGFVGADLAALTREAAVISVNRIFRTMLPTPTLRPALVDHAASSNMPEFALPASSSSTPSASSSSATLLSIDTAANGTTTPPTDSMDLDATPSTPTATDAHLHQPATRSQLHATELHHRSKASDKLRANVQPLTAQQLEPLYITMDDFNEAIKKVQPSSKREGFATIPDVTWNDIGALDELRDELNMTILQPILNPAQFEAIGLTIPAGVLLFGPPGCGKTLVAKAIANESGASFLSIKGPELLNQYVGQSERAVRKVFQRARASAPCVIFFDELDALVPKRGSGGSGGEGGGGSQVSERVVNQLLTEMDGLEERRNVFVIAATNRPDIIDPAMLRPGRLDKLLYVKLPEAGERAAILRKHIRRTPISSDVNVDTIAADVRANGFSGADLAALVREATITALREVQSKHMKTLNLGADNHTGAPTTQEVLKHLSTTLSITVCPRHFDIAFSKVFPSVSDTSRRRYDRMEKVLRKARSTVTAGTSGGSGEGEGKVDEEEGNESLTGAGTVAGEKKEQS